MLELTNQEKMLIEAFRKSNQGVNSILGGLSNHYASLAETWGRFPEIRDKYKRTSEIFEETRMKNIDTIFNKETRQDIIE